MKTKLILLAIIIFLTGCSESLSVSVPAIPDDWEYKDCPDAENFKCNLLFPLPKMPGFELQGHSNEKHEPIIDNAITSIDKDTYFIVQNLWKYKYSFEDILQCKDFQLQKGDTCDLTLRYIKKFSNYEVMAYKSDLYYLYILRIQREDTFFIRAKADEETVYLIDTSILNVKVVDE